MQSSTPDVDLQATISEVRPDGNETFVQNGWIRASERKLSTDSNNMFKRPSTTLEPIPTFTAADAAPMPAGQFVKVVVPLYYQGHAYRAGSRIRVTIAAPNGTQPIWAFDETVPSGTRRRSRSRTTMPSSLVLPVVPGVSVPTRAAAVPEPAQRAVPALPGDREHTRGRVAGRGGRYSRYRRRECRTHLPSSPTRRRAPTRAHPAP